MPYNTSAGFRKPAEIINPLSTGTSPAEWWREQSRIDGTDWKTLGTQAARVLWQLGFASSLAWGSS